MSSPQHVLDELGGYVLGALEPAEEAAVREHLSTCATCAAEHARLAGLPALLQLADGLEDVPSLPPPHAVEERVLDAVARERARPPARPRRRAWRPRVLVPAAGLAAVAAAALVLALGGGDHPRRYGVALHPAGAVAGRARAELESVPGGTTLRLWVRGLPRDPSAVYEVRCDSPDWTASAGTFRVDARGRAYVVLTTAARRGEYDRIRVVRRERDASGHASTAEVFTARLPS
jgi:hypothetical protein